MIRRAFHAWEHRLAAVDTRRVVRPFEWGLDWIGREGATDPLAAVKAYATEVMTDTPAFFSAPPTTAYEYNDGVLRFPSALETPWSANNVVVARVFEPERPRPTRPRRAVIVLPQWNSDPEGHVGLCRLFARFGIAGVRLTLPYHDERRPPEIERADYIVSANVGRTLEASRQAVLDARRVVDWLLAHGYEHIGIMGTSLGSCLSMLTMAHDARIRAGAFNHVSPFFADVVWRGLSTRHVRAGLEEQIGLEDLRECWMPISPSPFIGRIDGRAVLLVYAKYDLTFPVDLSRQFLAAFTDQRVPYDLAVLPCGHYSTGRAPFKFLDGYALTKFFVKRL
jgi:dienelactone hydrolase